MTRYRTLRDHWQFLASHLTGGWRSAGHKCLNTAVLYFGSLPVFGSPLWRVWGWWQRLL